MAVTPGATVQFDRTYQNNGGFDLTAAIVNTNAVQGLTSSPVTISVAGAPGAPGEGGDDGSDPGGGDTGHGPGPA